MRPLRVTRKRIVVNTCALEEFLTEFNQDLVDAIDTVWDYAYALEEAEERAKGKPEDAGFDDDDEVGNALIDLEYAMETLRDFFSAYPSAPDGGRHASQVLVGKRAGTITILPRTSREDLEYAAMKEKAAELLADDWPPEPAEPKPHRPRFPDEDDVVPVTVEPFVPGRRGSSLLTLPSALEVSSKRVRVGGEI